MANLTDFEVYKEQLDFLDAIDMITFREGQTLEQIAACTRGSISEDRVQRYIIQFPGILTPHGEAYTHKTPQQRLQLREYQKQVSERYLRVISDEDVSNTVTLYS